MAPKRLQSSPVSSPAGPSKKKAKSTPSSQRKLDFFFGQHLTTAETHDSFTPPSDATGSLVYNHNSTEIGGSLRPPNTLHANSLRSSASAVADIEVIDVDETEEITDVDDNQAKSSPSLISEISRSTTFSSPVKKGAPRFMVQGGTSTDASKTTVSYPSLNVDTLSYPISTLPWPQNKPAPYSFLAHALSSLAETRSRIAIINILTNALRTIILNDPTSLTAALYLLSNSLAPPYLAVELGLGSSIISKAIQHVSGLTSTALKKLYTKSGDAGDVAFEAKSNLRTLIPHAPLSVLGVYKSLLSVARTKGDGATKQKQSIVEKLLVAASGEEVRYLVRTLVQHIRVGAVRTSILIALARAMVLSNPHPDVESDFYISLSDFQEVPQKKGELENDKPRNENIKEDLVPKFARAESLIKRVFVQHPNYDDIVTALLESGLETLVDKVPLTIGIPLHPTLGSPTRSLDEIYERLGNSPFTAELKYDGQRAQIHASITENGKQIIKVFSRHLEDMTDKFPDVVFLVETIFAITSRVSSFIVDSEIVAIDPNKDSLKTFQELSGRARKDVNLQDVKINVCVYVFDLMLLNGECLLEEPFRVRRDMLRVHLPPMTPLHRKAARLDHVECFESTEGRDALESFWEEAINGRSEGLMIKLLDNALDVDDSDKTLTRRKPLPATYEPDKRTSAWLKLKKDYVESVGDSLDLVPIGAWHGNGRKAQWWSPVLLALWDENCDQFVGVCKCMSGFTDEFYKALSERYKEGSATCSRSPIWNCNTGGLKPTVYFKPQEVWEIRGADITVSPVSAAAFGLVSPMRGLSLRFPRFIRMRPDKSVTDASTPAFLANLWKIQNARGKKETAVDDGELIDAEFEPSEEENLDSE